VGPLIIYSLETKMSYSPETPVAQIVVEKPKTALVFQKYQIDYCCHGNTRLGAACAEKGVALDALQRELAEAEGYSPGETDWSTRPLTELCQHIVATHHQYLTRIMPQLAEMIAKIAEKHGENHPELAEAFRVYSGLKAELESHMMKEEMILFPAIQRMEQAQLLPGSGRQILGPVSVMLAEHDSAGFALTELRRLTNGYQVPEDACNTYRATILGLEDLERDLHQHIHKENNILFARAIGSDEDYAALRATPVC
jgi:regulator of cell morphogenesis and NO signaling